MDSSETNEITETQEQDSSQTGVDETVENTDSEPQTADQKPAIVKAARWIFKRHKFNWIFYIVAFIFANIYAVLEMQTVVDTDHELIWNFFSQMWEFNKFQFLNNFLILSLLSFIFCFIINRFWIAISVYVSLIIVIAVADRFKVVVRNETITAADLNFLSGGNAGNIMSFIPDGSTGIIVRALLTVALLVVFGIVMTIWDSRSLLAPKNKAIGLAARIIIIAIPLTFEVAFVSAMSTTDSWANKILLSQSDNPSMWDNVVDSRKNGTVVAFARNLNPKIMDEPANYSEATMKKILTRYKKTAQTINAKRTTNLNDSTVIAVLSESFSDPTRVPGVKLNKDPMPKIRAIKSGTTSGYMLSSGYGGGTANIEYMVLSGLSMANFSSSLTSPYQQLVPTAAWSPTFNTDWASSQSLAIHPYDSSIYSRRSNYKKFGFSKFYTLNGPQYVKHTKTIDRSGYVSDSETYAETLSRINAKKGSKSQFLQVVTMQNHMPYSNWYDNNDYTVTSTTGQTFGENEKTRIQTYAKGMEYTDTATADFLNKLDAIDKPITVIFYGDHLPGAYTTAAADEGNSVDLHETDYFIWSNKASGSSGNKLSAAESTYTSPNFLMEEAAAHMNAKVTPYLAFLTTLHTKVAALEPPVVNVIQRWKRIPSGQALYLDSQGNLIDLKKADKETKQLLADYKLIQYDITAGKQYLRNTDFMTYPKK